MNEDARYGRRTVATVTIEGVDEIESSFGRVEDVGSDVRFSPTVTVGEAFEGTHRYEEWAVRRTCTVERFEAESFADRLCVETVYLAGGEIVQELDVVFELADDGRHVECSGERIEAFCRANHFADPWADIEVAMGAV